MEGQVPEEPGRGRAERAVGTGEDGADVDSAVVGGKRVQPGPGLSQLADGDPKREVGFGAELGADDRDRQRQVPAQPDHFRGGFGFRRAPFGADPRGQRGKGLLGRPHVEADR